jgi:hypothetical protein
MHSANFFMEGLREYAITNDCLKSEGQTCDIEDSGSDYFDSRYKPSASVRKEPRPEHPSILRRHEEGN